MRLRHTQSKGKIPQCVVYELAYAMDLDITLHSYKVRLAGLGQGLSVLL